MYEGETLIATLRASDSVFVLDREGARRLHSHVEYPKNRVVVNSDAEPFWQEKEKVYLLNLL